jgi:hypothetical protein
MDLGTSIAIVSGVAATVYILETVGKYGYPLLKRNSGPPKLVQNGLAHPLELADNKKT